LILEIVTPLCITLLLAMFYGPSQKETSRNC
jgi:hypothetical protein